MLKEGTLILCFHRISDEDSPAYPPIPIKVFERICSYASRRLLPVSIFDKISSRKRQVIFTFDDAYLDFYEHALPILSKYKIPAIQHVITSCADTGEPFWTQKLNKIVETYYQEKQTLSFQNRKYELKHKNEIENTALSLYRQLLNDSNRELFIETLEKQLNIAVDYTPMMTWKALQDSLKYDIHIGSHTVNHDNLALLSETEIIAALKQSKNHIVSKLGYSQGKTIAYPNGQFNEKVLRSAKEIGYDYGFSTEAVKYTAKNNIHSIPRLMLYHNNWFKNYLKMQLLLLK
jgi:peptidoglycan/xylan/chitin deacetylase (PgdA/CDA1 family)